MNDQTNISDVVTAEIVDPFGSLGPSMLTAAANMLGLDLDALIDPDAMTFDDLVEAVDNLADTVAQLAAKLGPLLALADAAQTNAPKLRKFGIVL